MTPELRTVQFEKIDDNAEREKNKVKFVIDLIERDEERMRDVLLTDEERAADELSIAQKLFERTAQTIETVDNKFTDAGTVRVVRFMPDGQHPTSPAIELGWEGYMRFDEGDEEEVPDKVYAHVIHATSEGIEAINGWRHAQGYVTAEEQRVRNGAIWNKVSA